MSLNSSSKYKQAMLFGLILGIVQTVLLLFVHLLGIDIIRPPLFLTLINYTVVAIAIAYGTKKYRDELLGGVINYSTAYWFGVLICVFAGVILGLYMVLHVNFIDKMYLSHFFSAVEEEYNRYGFKEKEINDAMQLIGWMQKPLGMVFFKIFELSIMGIIVSLFTSISLKKNKQS